MTNATPGKSCRGALSPRNSAMRLIFFFFKRKFCTENPLMFFCLSQTGGWDSNPRLAAENMRLIGFITPRLSSLSLHTLMDALALNHQHSAPVPPLAAALILFKTSHTLLALICTEELYFAASISILLSLTSVRFHTSPGISADGKTPRFKRSISVASAWLWRNIPA